MERAECEKKIDELEKISDEKRKIYDACLEDVNNRTRDIYNIENFIKALKTTGTNGVQYDSAL